MYDAILISLHFDWLLACYSTFCRGTGLQRQVTLSWPTSRRL